MTLWPRRGGARGPSLGVPGSPGGWTLFPPRPEHPQRERISRSPGARRVAVDRDGRSGGWASRKPGIPRSSAPRPASLSPSDRTIRLRCLTLGLASKSRAGWGLPCPRCVGLKRRIRTTWFSGSVPEDAQDRSLALRRMGRGQKGAPCKERDQGSRYVTTGRAGVRGRTWGKR